MEEEIWKDIKGYEGLYQVSNLGRVKSLERKVPFRNTFKTIKERVLKYCYDGNHYAYISLIKNGEKKNKTVHRLVAEAFIPNPNNLPQVNHIDENKENNKLINLEWCDSLHNLLHSNVIKKGNNSRKKAIQQFTKDGKFIAEFNGVLEACRQLNFKSHAGIVECCKGTRCTAYGYKWKYKL